MSFGFGSYEEVAYAYNPSYLGGSRLPLTKTSQDPISTNIMAQWCIPVILNYLGGSDYDDNGPL
jgi:hypothetical protein